MRNEVKYFDLTVELNVQIVILLFKIIVYKY